MQLYTNSRAKDFRACPRLEHIKYGLGVRARSSATELRFGTLIHLGLEAWWSNSGEDRLEAAFRAMNDGIANVDLYERARAEAMMLGYHLRWQNEQIETLAVEQEFATDLRNPETGAASRTFQIAGKLDAIVRLADGRVAVLEHKTSSEQIGVGSEYWRRLTLDTQISTYFEGARHLGHPPDLCLYDVLYKPQQRPGNVPLLDADGGKIVLDAKGERVKTKDGKKWRQSGDVEQGYELQTRPETVDEFHARIVNAIAEDPERYYQRGEVVRLEQDERDAAYDAWWTAQNMRQAELADRHPRNPDACSRYGRTCEFFDVCTGLASLDDPLRFERVKPHRELPMVSANAG